MIKKILLTLLILIVLIVAGIISLVVFVDPNNFRGFISSTVKEQTGYELRIDGDLRWHIWPQISILTDSVRLEDQGAKKPILTADNMRLDVELLPLFSKELVVKNVLVKSAVINITDESKGSVAKGNKSTTTVNQTQTDKPKETSGSGWRFALNKLDIVDSTIVYQQEKDLISFRDINIAIEQKDSKNISLDLSGSVNRDQQDLRYTLSADANLANFPQAAQIDLHQLTYNYKGVGVPTGQLKGEVKATFNYQQSPFTLDSQDFNITVNGNSINGKLKANLEQKPYFEALLTADKFDLTPFLTSSPQSQQTDVTKSTQSQPVVANKAASGNELAFLQTFNAKFNLSINQVIADKVIINNFVIDANNQNGVATLNKVNLDIAKGHVTANGSANGNQTKALVKLATQASNIDLSVLLGQLALADSLVGQLNVDGNIAMNTINPEKIMGALTGDLAVKVNNARLENLNIQRIIQNAVSQYSKTAVTEEQYQKYTELHEISADASFADGDMNLSSIKALSATLDVTGSGRVGLTKQDLDVNLAVKILSGWNGDSKTIQKLQQMAIPLRIYGPFTQLHYRVEADKIIKDVLSNKLQNEIDKLKGRLGNNEQTSTDEQSNTTDTDKTQDEKPKAKELLGNFLNKIK
ncbi:AsmA protein [Orbus hercynius]|uniref:AsmA protein n=1 Tax=Orbus hercynius TaxID=593135 RepID=A0A495RAX8_9GAMM|nr:outer membrane assembly protein AsmA [Orbus hercynius]RKS84637.1 AsmA protein [Orbus hercynius]